MRERDRSRSADGPGPTRRTFLATAGSVALGALGSAGCLDLGGSGTETATAVPETLPAPSRGDGDVTMTVYEDLACPACRTFHEQFVPVIDRDYVEPGVVTYEFRDFPLEMHAPRSFEAANAARAVQAAAGEAAFFSYVDSLFANQNSLSPDTYAELAGDVGVDGDQIRAAAVGQIYRNTIDRDLSRGQDAGVRGTPTVFVDGEQPAELSMNAIAAAIEAARSQDS